MASLEPCASVRSSTNNMCAERWYRRDVGPLGRVQFRFAHSIVICTISHSVLHQSKTRLTYRVAVQAHDQTIGHHRSACRPRGMRRSDNVGRGRIISRCISARSPPSTISTQRRTMCAALLFYLHTVAIYGMPGPMFRGARAPVLMTRCSSMMHVRGLSKLVILSVDCIYHPSFSFASITAKS